ncbi:ABC transporter permease [Sedimenticola selenatireducens]|uniref:ABC transporter permease n=1 Tax=Sedimenticola selenatireducens TaxID=191960 RepID=UPI0004B36DBE|nr:ABC transporter permease [Sedimenticola selenatireducens]
MSLLLNDLWINLRSQGLLQPLVRREISARTAGTGLGVAWLYLQPLAMMAVYLFLFDIIFAIRLGEAGTSERMGLFLIVGMTPWLAFADGLKRAANSLVAVGNMLQKNPLPILLFPLRTVLASFLIYLPLFLVMVGLALYYKGFTWAVLWFVPLWLSLGLLILLAGSLLSLMTAASRDSAEVLGLFLSVGFFVAPIIYPMSRVPEVLRPVLWLNPATPWVTGMRSVLLTGETPSAGVFIAIAAWLALLLLLLSWTYQRCSEQVVDWL